MSVLLVLLAPAPLAPEKPYPNYTAPAPHGWTAKNASVINDRGVRRDVRYPQYTRKPLR